MKCMASLPAQTRPAQRLSRRLLVLLGATLLFAACGEAARVIEAKAPGKDTACVLDGMLLTDFPGPKAQIHYEQGGPDFFCDTKEMFSMILRPEEKRRVLAVYTQDMARADWTHPEGAWIDARKAFYVVGSRMTGSMGQTFASFAAEADAQAFAVKNGGKVLRFDQVTVDMADLSGGAAQDKRM